jgi:hypothetical protein
MMYNRVRIVHVNGYWKYHIVAKGRFWPFWVTLKKLDSELCAKQFCNELANAKFGLHKGKPIIEEYVRVGSQYAKDACLN